jgi:hypothetical protein
MKQKVTMNQDRLMKLVPAGVVLAVAVFLGLAREGISDLLRFYALFGYGVAIALLVVAAYDYRRKLRLQIDR